MKYIKVAVGGRGVLAHERAITICIERELSEEDTDAEIHSDAKALVHALRNSLPARTFDLVSVMLLMELEEDTCYFAVKHLLATRKQHLIKQGPSLLHKTYEVSQA